MSNDLVKIVAIGTTGVVSVLSFILLPGDTEIHHVLVYGLLSLIGVNIVGNAFVWVANKLKITG